MAEAVPNKFKQNQKKKSRKPKEKNSNAQISELEKLLGPPTNEEIENLSKLQISDLDEPSCSHLEFVENKIESIPPENDKCDQEENFLENFKPINQTYSEESAIERLSQKSNNNQNVQSNEVVAEDNISSDCIIDFDSTREPFVVSQHSNMENIVEDAIFYSYDDSHKIHYNSIFYHEDGTIEKGCEALQISEPTDQLAAPSAPVMQSVHSNINRVHYERTFQSDKSQDDTKSSGAFQNQNKYLQKIIETYKNDQTSSIKPFTEAQLASLYNNMELANLKTYTEEFVAHELNGSSMICSPLYDMLVNYLRARGKVTTHNVELEMLTSEAKQLQQCLWWFETVTVTELGECQDGNSVKAKYNYKISRYNQKKANKLSKTLLSIRDLVSEGCSLNSYTCQVLKLQIDNYIQNIILDFSFLPQNSPISLLQENLPAYGQFTGREMMHILSELRVAISILFSFQRRHIKDEGFINDTREWLSRLVAVLLRVSSWKDHIYLLNHVLRCPAGVGKWAASFIQPPIPPFNTPFTVAYLDHLVTTVSCLLLPIAERDNFLTQWNDSLNIDNEALWVVVDSDGEDVEDSDGVYHCKHMLKESDIVELFDQIPFDNIFRQVLNIKQRDNRDEMDMKVLAESQVLKVFAFSSILLKLFEKGLLTYNGAKYRQFAKRLGRLIRHTVQYCTDLFQAFQTECVASIRECDRDLAMLERLQVEYDAFFMRAVHILNDSPGNVAWQFLAVLPFSHVSSNKLWQIFLYLFQYDLPNENNDEDNKAEEELNGSHKDRMPKSQSQELLMERLCELQDSEVYYLLTTLTNMALARPQNDWSFIQTATLHLLQIGFLNEGTRDNCSKSGRIMLTYLTNKYPSLISVIIDKLKISQPSNLSLYLMKELPISAWQPSELDLTVLADWLLYFPLNSYENTFSRYLLSHLNWDFCSGDSQELFLPWSMHCRVGLLIARAAAMYASETPNISASAISESVKQMSYYASSMVRSQANEQAFGVWIWQMIFRLRIHLMDQSDTFVWNLMANPAMSLSALPDLNSQNEEMELLRELVKQQECMAILISILMTTVGHSIPLIYAEGFSLMLKLQTCYRYSAVLFLLQHIFPLFLDCPQSLLTSESFREVVLNCLSADRSFLKMARNLMAPEFPGIILKQFGDMIQYHLEHFRRYSLGSPAPLVHLWLQVLCSVWAEDTASVVYLMDIVLQVAFFHPDLKISCSDILSQLLQKNNVNKQSGSSSLGGISSLISWVSSSGTSIKTLFPKSAISCPHSPWFAYFALEIEEFNVQTRNGLWKAVLRELANSSGKTSVDNAIKKAANSLKIPVETSSSLSIYRWSQQALDTPLDHPVLPLMWQKFFLLYLTRISSASGVQDRGSVGEKFFEGMTNTNYLKKLKKKLSDCHDYHYKRALDADGVLIPEQRSKADLLCKLYKTLTLWLEEPKLHETGLFLPALPPQFNPILLTSVISGDQTPWFEFIDQDAYNKTIQDGVTRWIKCQCRHLSMSILNSVRAPLQQEERNPVKRIIKRLQSYDSVSHPPSLKFGPPAVPPVTGEVILNKGRMLDSVQSSISALAEFAKLYALRLSQHKALDCTLLELLPTLFRDIENEVVLYAACDTESSHRRSRIDPNTLICGGPAEIRIKILEARLNEGIDREILTNRMELEGILKLSLQPPPQQLCVASVHLELLTQALQKETTDLFHHGDVDLLANAKSVGVTLFYHLTKVFSEESLLYPPIKQLITTCIELLGQTFIAGEESECIQLLNTVLYAPQLTGLLAPHFTPSISSPSTFIQLYASLVSNTDSSKSSDLTFVLLSKIDLSRWLPSSKPKLCDRSELIELAIRALTYTGKTPDESHMVIHEAYKKHLCQLMMYDFPEHYGEVLVHVLKQSETQSIAPDVWFDLINALTSCKFQPNTSLGQIKEEIRKFVTEQKILTAVQLRDTVKLLADHFTKERLQYGLYGLYPKYRDYIDAFTILLGIVGHAVVAARLHKDRGTLGDKLSEQLWPCLSNLFTPWITPYFTRNLAEPTAAWIQQLTDDRSVLPPWIVTDGGCANKMTCMFTECIKFMLETMPGCNNILSFVWQFYVVNFAHSSVKDYILNLIHSRLLTLPWSRFTPNFQDIDLMLRVVDQYLPYCHTFLGAIFIEIPWHLIIKHVSTNCTPMVVSKTHCALLHLLIKLSNEPNIRQSGKVTPLLLESQKFLWHLVDDSSYELVTNWFVMSYDPRVILYLPDKESNGIDLAALELLQVAAGHVGNAPQYHPSTPKKRQIYVRATVKLLISCLSRYKPLITSRNHDVKMSIKKMVDKIEGAFVSSTPGPQRASEAGLLLSELLVLVNQSPNSNVSLISIEAITEWLSTRDCSSVVISGFLRVLTTTVNDEQALGTLMESTLTAFFRRRVTVAGSSSSSDWWCSAASVMQPTVRRSMTLEDILINNGQLLTLYMLVLKSLPTTSITMNVSPEGQSKFVNLDDVRKEAIVLNKLVDWIGFCKPLDTVEPKVMLLICKAIHLCYRQSSLSDDPSAAAPVLNRLIIIVNKFAEQRSGTWNFLGAIGIRKQLTMSNRFRFLCRAVAAILAAQLPEKKNVPETAAQYVRIKERSPGNVTLSVTDDEIVPSQQAIKMLSNLQNLLLDKSYSDIKDVISIAIAQTVNPETSLHNAHNLIGSLAAKLYSDSFLYVQS